MPSKPGADGAPRFTVDMMLRGVGEESNTFRPVRTVWEESPEGPKLVTFTQKSVNALINNGSGPINP